MTSISRDLRHPTPGHEGDGPIRPFAPAHAFRSAMRALPTGVAVITTTAPDGRSIGLTVNSMASLSLEPPLVSWALRVDSPLAPIFQASRWFCMNVLSAAQAALAQQFSSRVADRFDGVACQVSEAGMPRIDGCSAWLECSLHADLGIGDHLLFVGAVRQADAAEETPLGWYAGRYFEPELALR